MATMTYRFAQPDPAPVPDRKRTRIAVFGAAGATGQLAVRQALAAGYRVSACVADPQHLLIAHDALRLVQADVLAPHSLHGVLAGHDAVLCLVGHKPESLQQHERPRGERPVGARATRHLLAAMAEAGVQRIVLLGAAGIGSSRRSGRFGLGFMLRWMLPEVMADKERQEALLRQSTLRWTVLRPGPLSHAPASGRLRVGENLPWGWHSTSREDVAALMVRLIDDPSVIGKALTVV
jgi:putative NADH-flavin reductase